jgi:hypothetical protein
VALFTLFGLAGPGPALAATPPTEAEVKAAFLYHFTQYVEWPKDTPGDKTFLIAVLGDDEFLSVAERTLLGKSAARLPLRVRGIREPAEAPPARILFIGAGETRRLEQVLQAVEGAGVLTVGDAPGFAEQGGMIGFRVVDNRVRFDINTARAARAGFRISSQVLKLARLVGDSETR